jgi:hypothetical protein
MESQFYKITHMVKLLLKKYFWFIFSLLLILTAVVFGYLINKINFCGETTIQINSKNKETNFYLFAYSPTGRIVEFYKKNSTTYFIKGYYNSLNIKVPDKEFRENLDSASININGKIFRFDRNNFSGYWSMVYTKKNNSCYSLNPEIASANWFNKFYALIFFTFPAYVLCFFLLAFVFVVYFFYGDKFRFLINKLLPLVEKKILLICFVLFVIYVAVFSCISKLDNKIEITKDYHVYQILAVNLINGPNLNSQTIFEKYQFDNAANDSIQYKFAIHDCEYSYSDLSAWVPPVYPMFLAAIYKIFGVSPFIARYIQLLLLLIVAAFIPLLIYNYFKMPGFILGIFAGLIFIINIYPIANEIMTEPLTIFFCFLLLCAINYFELKKSTLSATLLGVTLTIALLVKGIVVFVILFYFIVLIYRYFKLRGQLYSKRILRVFIAFLISILPWVIYTNLNEGIIQISSLSKKELSEDKLRLKNILSVVEKRNTINQFDSTLRAINKNEFNVHQFATFINRAYNVLSDNHISDLQKRDFLLSTLRQFIVRLDNILKVPSIKLNDNNYIYFNKPILISTNHTYEIFESNNKNCIDGDIHNDNFIKETYDNHPNYPSFIRVMNFYCQNPRYILIIFPNKLFRAYNHFPFVSLLISLIIANFIFLLMLKRKLVNNIFQKGILFLMVPFLMFCANYSIVGFSICFILALLGICVSLLKKMSLFLFELPLSFNLMILNFILITLIFFGIDRITSIVDFVFTTSSILYFFYYYGLIAGRTVFKKT